MEKPTDKGMDDVEQVAKAIHETGLLSSARLSDQGQAAITAYKAWLKDNGWAIVPSSPTKEMLTKGWAAAEDCRDETTDTYETYDITDFDQVVSQSWAAMLKEGEMAPLRTGSSPPYRTGEGKD